MNNTLFTLTIIMVSLDNNKSIVYLLYVNLN